MFSWLNRLRYSEFWARDARRQAACDTEGGAVRRQTRLDCVDDPGLQVKQEGAGHVVVVVRLVEEHVLAVARAVCGILLQHAVLADAVLQAQLRGGQGGRCQPRPRCSKSTTRRLSRLAPELAANLVAALANLQRDNFTARTHGQGEPRKARATGVVKHAPRHAACPVPLGRLVRLAPQRRGTPCHPAGSAQGALATALAVLRLSPRSLCLLTSATDTLEHRRARCSG